MAARRGVILTTEHRNRVAAGLATLSEVATELGLTKQALFVSFKRRSWPTKAIELLDDGESQAPASEADASAAQRPVSTRRARSAHSRSPTASGATEAAHGPAIAHPAETGSPASAGELDNSTSRVPPAAVPGPAGREVEAHDKAAHRAPTARASARSAERAPSPPPAPSTPGDATDGLLHDDLGGTELAAEDVAEYARRAVATACLQALERANDILAKPIAATSLRAAVAAIALAADQLARAGYEIGAEAAATPQLLISEMSREEEQSIRNAAEAEYRGEMPGDLDADPNLADGRCLGTG